MSIGSLFVTGNRAHRMAAGAPLDAATFYEHPIGRPDPFIIIRKTDYSYLINILDRSV